MLTTEMARLELRQQFPDYAMEIEEYISFADFEKLTKTELLADFQEYMDK